VLIWREMPRKVIVIPEPLAAAETHASCEAVRLANRHKRLAAELAGLKVEGVTWVTALRKLRMLAFDLKMPGVIEQTVERSDDAL
jgi:hypothetical protein